jgi:hypothetical protein
VTEPGGERIEVFSLPVDPRPTPAHAAYLRVAGGPESLVIDGARGRAYTHLWGGETLAIDLKSRAIVERWKNGCTGSRGLALDEKRGWLLVGCDEGTAVVLDVAHGGRRLGQIASSARGVDVIDFNPTLSHLYLPGGDSGTMVVVAVSETAQLTQLATVATAKNAHCVVADPLGNAWICDPARGQLLRYRDAAR